ncbi:MAG: 16S rRNA (cytosine(967)-C(5))-methyltransferase RsmB [Ruminococcaceae bacterium]|nr:16S rRNA (cytosine(967)-C(5))-methyltransferase RsmB [Oscillospiraceae bacterium]
MVNPRSLAVKILIKIEKDNAYSNLTLNAFFEETEISPLDKAFVTNLVYGVIERKITLDYVLKTFIKTPLKKVTPITLNTLRIALYQIMFMDKIPESSAVNEAVKCIKKSKESRNSGFVNAVLRNILRAEYLLPQGESIDNLSVIYSCPCEIIESYINDYGFENTKLLLEESLKPAPLTVRVNTLKTDIENFVNNVGVETKLLDIDGAVELKNGISIGNNSLYNDGLFFVQDTASQRVVNILNPKSGERMLDMCAAPGGKSFSSAILMENEGEIVSCDLYEHKCNLIKKSAERLGLDIIKPTVCDATVFNTDLGYFDCVLCDVPCSGLGIIRRKPEIKYKDFKEFDNLPEIGLKILNNAKNYLKPQGRILYSTCTLRKAENECVVEQFLKENPEFSLEYSHTFMPHTDNTDGFYCALLKK